MIMKSESIEEAYKHIRADAARLMIEQLVKFKKKIPKRGLNNMTKPKYLDGFGYHTSPDGSLWSIPPKPTLPDRMEKLFWYTLYLPPQMVAMGITSEQFDKDSVKSAMIECLELLTNLYDNLDSVTVVSVKQISQWKEMIWRKKKYLMVTAKLLGMVVEI